MKEKERRPFFADEWPLLETSIFPLSFQVVREPVPFAYRYLPQLVASKIYMYNLQ